MDFEQYVAARHRRLVEHAVLLGCSEDEAAPSVDRVLQAHRRRIGRAEDPDPSVHEAQGRAVRGPSARDAGPGPLAALGLVALVVAVAGW